MEYKTESKAITVKAFTDAQGKPCCAANFTTGDVCQFYRTRWFGKYETCCAVSTDNQSLYRDDDDPVMGLLRPHEMCPIWNPKVVET